MLMMDILQRVEQMLPEIQSSDWKDCCQHGLRRSIEPYVVELHKTKKPFNVGHPTMALKIISGHCQAELKDEGMQYLGRIVCEAGFEYTSGLGTFESNSALSAAYYHNIKLLPVEDAITFLLIYPNCYCTEYSGSHICKNRQDILDDIALFYPSSTTKIIATKEKSPLKWRIGHEVSERCVVIDFEQPINWMALSPEEAEQAANRLLHHARKARGF